jgi:uroporphyrinogen decarboxylase
MRLTSKERVALAIAHHETDRVPFEFHARDEIRRRLSEHWGLKAGESAEQRLGTDMRWVGPAFKLPTEPLAYADPSIARDGQVYRDIWGVGFVSSQTPSGQYLDLADSPLRGARSLDDIARHPWPSADWWDYSVIPARLRPNQDYWCWGHCRGIFEISWFLRGFEEFLADLAGRLDWACAVMDRVEAYLFERTRRILQAGEGRIDMIEYNDDVGSQMGLLVSPGMWRAMLKPRMARIVWLCKQHGAKVRYHCCGGLRPIIPDLIDLAVDVLNPVQPLAQGMDPLALKRDFGRALSFDGGVDTQELLPHSSADEVREHTRKLIAEMSRGGGYILGPAHAFQGDVPVENVLAVYEAALGRRL